MEIIVHTEQVFDLRCCISDWQRDTSGTAHMYNAAMNYKGLLQNHMTKLSDSFRMNELAYLALTSKIELPIRDKMAYRIFLEQFPNYISAREWKRSDLVLLNNFEPACIVEFKAMYTFNAIFQPSKFKKLMENDIKKAFKIGNQDTEVYSIILATHPCKVIFEEEKYEKIIKYCNKGINKAYDKFINSNTIKETAKENFESQFKNQDRLLGGTIKAGTAFDIEVEILYWIYGPHMMGKS